MPIYRYRCAECDHEFSVLVMARNKDKIECPECTSNLLEKLVSKSSFKLKGKGWFKDGYKK